MFNMTVIIDLNTFNSCCDSSDQKDVDSFTGDNMHRMQSKVTHSQNLRQ